MPEPAKRGAEQEKMEQLMYDVYLAEATMETDYQNFDSPEKRKHTFTKYSKHITLHKHDGTSLSWYSDQLAST